MTIVPNNEPLTRNEKIASVIITIVIILIVGWCFVDLSTVVIDGVTYYVWPVNQSLDHTAQREGAIVTLFFSQVAFFFGVYLGNRGFKQD